MPHREQKHLDELSKSLEKIENHNITNISWVLFFGDVL
jgi:hypothetical protein